MQSNGFPSPRPISNEKPAGGDKDLRGGNEAKPDEGEG